MAKGAGTTYSLPNGSSLDWESALWTLAGGDSTGLFPNAAGDTAQYLFSTPATTALNRTGGGAITLGRLVVGGSGNWTIGTGTASGFVFDNTGGAGNATITTAGSGSLEIAPNILIQNTNLDITTGTDQTGTITITGTISGTGDVSLSGARGQTVITLGTVDNDGILRAEVASTGFAATTFAVTSVGSNVDALVVGNAANTFGGTLRITGTSTFTGPITIQGAAALATNTAGLNGSSVSSGITFGTGGGSLAASAGSITTVKAITLTGNGTFVTGAAGNDITLSGAIGGAGGLAKTGLGYLILSGTTSNTYAGDTTVLAGAFTGQLSLQKTGGAIAVPGDLILDGSVSGNSAGIGTAANSVRNQFGQQFGANSVIRFVNNSAATHAYFSLYGNDQTVAGISESVGSGGIIQVSQLEAFAIDSTLTINNSADFSFAGYLRDASANGTGKLGLIKAGAGKQALVGDKISYSGPTTINAGTLELSNATQFRSAVTFGAGSTGILQLASAALGITGLASDDTQNNLAIVQPTAGTNAVLTVSQSGDSSFGGVLRDNGIRTLGLTKAGAGTLTLTGNNSNTGTTTLLAGKLSLGSANALGSAGTISFTGGTLQYTAANTTDYSSRFSSAASQAVRIDTNGQTVTLAGNLISSGGTLTKDGAGTLILSGANTYNGTTTINEGVLEAGSATAFGGTNTLTFAAGAPAGTKFRLAGFNVSVGSAINSGLFTASTTAVVENGSNTTDATLTVLSGNANTYAGILQDGGTAKLNFTRGGGASTLTFTGANTYTGITTLNSGILAVTVLNNGGLASGIGAASSAASNLVLNGGVLSYAGNAATTTNRSFTLGTTGGLDASGATGADTVTFTETAAFSFLAPGAHTLILRGTNTGNNTLAAEIIDSGGATGLTKLDGGTWVLTNDHTYTGATTISGGRLIVDGSLGATAVTASGGALGGTGTIGTSGGTTGVTLIGGSTPETRGLIDLTDGSIGTLTIQAAAGVNGLTIGGATGNAAGLRFELAGSGASDVIAISTAKVLVNDGGARVDVTGLSGFGLGTYNLLSFDAGQATGLNNLYLGSTAGGGYSYALVQTATAVQLLVSASATSATWNVNAAGNWFTGSNWTGGVAPNGTGASATFGNAINAPRVVTLDASATVGTLTFNSTFAYTLASSGGSILALNNNGAGAGITVTTGSHTISAPLALTEATTMAVNGTALSISGAIGGTGRLLKSGAGTLTLSGANTYSGGTTITGGTLRISAENNLGAAPAAFTADSIVLDGGTLRSMTTGVTLGPTRGIALGANGGTLWAEGGNFTIQGNISDLGPGAGALTISGPSLYVTNTQSTYSGGTILTGIAVPQSSSIGPAGAPTSGPFGTGTLTLTTGSQMRATSAVDITLANNVNLAGDVTFITTNTLGEKNLTFTGGVTLTGGTRTVTSNPSISNNLTVFAGAIGDGGNNLGLIKAGGGILALGGANTFTGGLTINAGTLVAQTSAGALGGSGTGAVTLGATSGSVGATLLVSDNVTYANPITVRTGSSGVMTIGNSGAAAPVLSGVLTLQKALTLASSGTGSLTISGAITGSSALTVTGSSGNFVQLSGNNAAYTGDIAVASGTLRIGASSAVNATNVIAVSAGATLELNGTNVVLEGLTASTGSGTVNNNGVALNTLTLAGSGAYAFGGSPDRHDSGEPRGDENRDRNTNAVRVEHLYRGHDY